jgi:hypothetical protein
MVEPNLSHSSYGLLQTFFVATTGSQNMTRSLDTNAEKAGDSLFTKTSQSHF